MTHYTLMHWDSSSTPLVHRHLAHTRRVLGQRWLWTSNQSLCPRSSKRNGKEGLQTILECASRGGYVSMIFNHNSTMASNPTRESWTCPVYTAKSSHTGTPSLINRDQGFPRPAEFWAEPRNLWFCHGNEPIAEDFFRINCPNYRKKYFKTDAFISSLVDFLSVDYPSQN